MSLSLNQLITLTLSLGTLAAVVAFVIVYAKQGGSRASKEVFEWQKEQISNLKEENLKLRDTIQTMQKEHAEQLSVVKGQIENLKGQFQQVQAKNEEFKRILENRDPASVGLQGAAMTAIQNIAEMHSILKAAYPNNDGKRV